MVLTLSIFPVSIFVTDQDKISLVRFIKTNLRLQRMTVNCTATIFFFPLWIWWIKFFFFIIMQMNGILTLRQHVFSCFFLCNLFYFRCIICVRQNFIVSKDILVSTTVITTPVICLSS